MEHLELPFDKDGIWKLYNDDLANLSHERSMGRKSAESKGHPYYGILRELYNYPHFISFSGMHSRLKYSKLATDFPRTLEGFIDYIVYMGPVPSGMERPVAGRIDHSVGYLRGNFAWQSAEDNNRESALRNQKNGKWLGYQTCAAAGMQDWNDGVRNYRLQPDDPKIKELNLNKGRLYTPDERVQCPHCLKEGGIKRMKQIHFDKCYLKDSSKTE